MTKLIALDNGHGIDTPGKRTPIFTDGTKSAYTGANFMHEWEFNRATVILVREELERCGFHTLEISPTEADMPINDRYKKANDAGADFFLSVHANALTSSWGTSNGIETLVKKSEASFTSAEKARIAESIRVGKLLNAALVKATGLRDRCANMPNKLLEKDDIGVLNWTKMPAALVECGFMDNLAEAKNLLTPEYRKLCAVACAKALCVAFGVTYKEEKPVAKQLTKFPDVPAGNWAEADIKTVSDAGIMKGYPDGSFKPGQTITRAEVAAIVANMLIKK